MVQSKNEIAEAQYKWGAELWSCRGEWVARRTMSLH